LNDLAVASTLHLKKAKGPGFIWTVGAKSEHHRNGQLATLVDIGPASATADVLHRRSEKLLDLF
jgi:hypothetical protein